MGVSGKYEKWKIVSKHLVNNINNKELSRRMISKLLHGAKFYLFQMHSLARKMETFGWNFKSRCCNKIQKHSIHKISQLMIKSWVSLRHSYFCKTNSEIKHNWIMKVFIHPLKSNLQQQWRNFQSNNGAIFFDKMTNYIITIKPLGN